MTRGVVWAVGVALVALLVWGLEQVIVSPLETGDIYPPFSSLRSDPMGARALFESLAEQPGVEVDRLYKERTEIGSADEAFLVLGVDPIAWSGIEAKDLADYEKLVKRGGRLVIGFVPVRDPGNLPKERPVEGVWDLRLRYHAQTPPDDSNAIPRKSALYFEAGPAWRRGDGFIERQFGAGTIVLAAQTFALSNEGLREARDPALIAALVGPAHQVVFDENHFGVVETGSVAKLMRKYQLEGAVAILGAVFVLFLWRSASSFLPPRGAPARDSITGRDSLEGMTALLHRGVSEPDLINVCFAEWARTERNPSKTARVEDAIRGRAQDTVAAYRAACAAVSGKGT